MDIFWSISIAGGSVTQALPESRLMDARFIDTFTDWAP
jgi:hypothetical protein